MMMTDVMWSGVILLYSPFALVQPAICIDAQTRRVSAHVDSSHYYLSLYCSVSSVLGQFPSGSLRLESGTDDMQKVPCRLPAGMHRAGAAACMMTGVLSLCMMRSMQNRAGCF